MTETEVRQVLGAFGIPINCQRFVTAEQAAVLAAEEIGYPVALKVVSPDVVHKSDIGGVRLNLTTDLEIRAAYRDITAICTSSPGVALHGVSVQAMVDGVAEMIVGVKWDETFGPVIMVGFGGVWVELMRDVDLAIPPTSSSDVRRMLERLRGLPLLRGFRGRPLADEESLVDIVCQVSAMAMKFPGLRELDLNPVIVRERGNGALVVDARANVDWDMFDQKAKPPAVA